MHRTVISWSGLVAASVIALVAQGCACDDCNGLVIELQRANLLALARADAATPPPGAVTVQVKNSQTRTVRITHGDSTQTLFAELTFPAGTFVESAGRTVCDTCTVTVSIVPTAGVYGFRLGPSGIVFRASLTPTVTFSYGRYADFSVRDSSTLYPTAQAFDLALRLWYETPAGGWRVSRNSSRTGGGTVAGAIDAPGAHLLAARK